LQAVSFADSALQAEAQALELAAQIGKSLQVEEANFLTDNQILANALTRRDPTNYPGHWIIRPNLYQFLDHLQGIKARVFKIRRENNIVAHRQAQEAFNSHRTGPCAFNCSGTRHSSDLCPVKAVINNLNVQYSTLLSVTCQWTECKIFWVAKKKKLPWPPRPNRQRDGQFGSAESYASAWPDRRYRTGGVASSMNETTSWKD
jgi:hypothetical protein